MRSEWPTRGGPTFCAMCDALAGFIGLGCDRIAKKKSTVASQSGALQLINCAGSIELDFCRWFNTSDP